MKYHRPFLYDLPKSTKVDVHTMILAIAATQIELEPFLSEPMSKTSIETFVCGVGPVETAFRLSNHLASQREKPSLIVNFGIGGAYLNSGCKMLDICLATSEVFGDFGVALDEGIQPFSETLGGKITYALDPALVARAQDVISSNGFTAIAGNFITVNSTSGTRKRGDALRDSHKGVCENMEGASIARVCDYYEIDFIEVRCISNMVEDRNPASWKISEASQKAGKAAAVLANNL